MEYKIIFQRYATTHRNPYPIDNKGRVRHPETNNLWLEGIETFSGKTRAHLWISERDILEEGYEPKKPRQRFARKYIIIKRDFALRNTLFLSEDHTIEAGKDIDEKKAFQDAARAEDRYERASGYKRPEDKGFPCGRCDDNCSYCSIYLARNGQPFGYGVPDSIIGRYD
jgi:hypothetical protein